MHCMEYTVLQALHVHARWIMYQSNNILHITNVLQQQQPSSGGSLLTHGSGKKTARDYCTASRQMLSERRADL